MRDKFNMLLEEFEHHTRYDREVTFSDLVVAMKKIDKQYNYEADREEKFLRQIEAGCTNPND
jgi:hypothetical protein